jgi:hypothetical protein
MNVVYGKDMFDRNLDKEEKERKQVLAKYASDIKEMYNECIKQKDKGKSDKRKRKQNGNNNKNSNDNDSGINAKQNKTKEVVEQNDNDNKEIKINNDNKQEQINKLKEENKRNNILYIENNNMNEALREYYYNKNKNKGTMNRINQLLSINPLSKDFIKEKVIIDPDTERDITIRKTKQKQYKEILDKQNFENKKSNYYYRDPNYNPCKSYIYIIFNSFKS